VAGPLLDQWFHERGLGPTLTHKFRLVATDGSTLQEPGSEGTDWRLHTQWNLADNRWERSELADADGAESLTQGTLRPDDVVLSDENDGRPEAIAWIRSQQAH